MFPLTSFWDFVRGRKSHCSHTRGPTAVWDVGRKLHCSRTWGHNARLGAELIFALFFCRADSLGGQIRRAKTESMRTARIERERERQDGVVRMLEASQIKRAAKGRKREAKPEERPWSVGSEDPSVRRLTVQPCGETHRDT